MAIGTLAHTTGPGAVAPPAPGRSGRKKIPYLLLFPGMLWLVVFFAVPIFTLLSTSVEVPAPSGETGVFVPAFRVANYWEAADTYLTQFTRAFVYGGLATIFALLIGYPLAYMIAFKSGRWRNLLLVLVVAPFFCSFVLRTLAWGQILGDSSWVVGSLKFLHILSSTQSLTSTPFAVVAGITYNFLPFMTLPLYSSLERIDPRLMEAGYDLYGNGLTVLRKVTFPLSMPGVVAGTLLTFIPAAGDYVNAQLLGNVRTQMIGNVIQSRFFTLVDYPTAAALSFILMGTILIMVILYIRRSGTEELV